MYQRAHFYIVLKGLIKTTQNYLMDICITTVDNKSNKSLRPLSIHGMLWLQTHFENDQWEAISHDKVIISEVDSKLLIEDANLAGVRIESMSDISIMDVLPKTN